MPAKAETPPELTVDALFRAGDWDDREGLCALAARAIGAAAASLGGIAPPAGEVSVVFTDDDDIRGLNARHRGRDAPTNVLAFPMPADPSGRPLLGDIVIARETIVAEAEEQGLTVDHHITHLLVHGFLHLLGFDHGSAAEAAAMEGHETDILARLGLGDPHAAAPTAAKS